ncbi:TniQ family protein [Streptomyces sp. NBC_00873]|uniref:TniQ family protein n=1 Tax=unclassified Streptomyces TaxID=2593676 RepID=UPI00386A017D|nr:TniQ family protein [Streptomyces sp. NBC_00873]WSY96906.1 TniQ family protein [Streptomyces sp. NBC_00873]WTA41321.1 TniQ family protein [Streptomyces sp. NBC_00842]WTA48576.1 TniQ family protein [Streptomyces sp. NBC_00842]
MTRTLPLRLPPLPGEAMDSWLEAAAAQLRAPLADLLGAVGLHKRAWVWRVPWLVLLEDEEADSVAATTGIPQTVLRAMTLAHFDQRAVLVDRGRRNVDHFRSWKHGTGTGSRYCPECLKENGGRWQLSWRLGWVYACIPHRRLLADTCPRCGARPRTVAYPGTDIPSPGRCGHLSRHDPGTRRRCLFPFSEVDVPLLAAHHPALRAQQDLADTVKAGLGSFGVYRSAEVPALDVLADIKALGRRALTVLSADQLAQLIPNDLAQLCRTAVTELPTTERKAIYNAAVTAASVTAAWTVLRQTDLRQAGARMQLLTDVAADRDRWLSPTAPQSWARYSSPMLRTAHAASLAPRMRQTDQLRYRIAAPRPGSPSADTAAVRRRAAKTPALLWPTWQVRLDPGVRLNLGTALSVALMLVDSPIDLTTASEKYLHGLIEQPVTTHVLQALRDAPQWEGIQLALIRLADYLDHHDVPIDYARRRQLDYTHLLPAAQWKQVCNDALLQPGYGRRHQHARSFLFERISGLPYEQLPGSPGPSHAFNTTLKRFPFLLTPDLLAGLDRVAHEFLACSGVLGEPLTWEPPTELLHGLDLPWPGPEDLDLEDLHRRVATGERPAEIAKTLGTDLPILRLALINHPAPAQQVTRANSRTARKGRSRSRNNRSEWRKETGLQTARRLIPEDLLEDLYVQQGQSFQKIAEDRGLHPRDVSPLVDEYGLPRHNHCPGGKADPEWLHTQYIELNRTITDIADDADVSFTVIMRWLRTHKLTRPTDPKGQRRFSRPTHDFGDADPLLQPVLSNNYHLRRLRIFLRVAGYPMFATACDEHGLSRTAVNKAFKQLEADLGGQLVDRASKGRSMQLTEFGQRVARAALPLADQLGVRPEDTERLYRIL